MDEPVDARDQRPDARQPASAGVADGAAAVASGAAGGPRVSGLFRLPRSEFLQGSVLLLSSTLLASAGNYLFNVIAGRALGPDTYGALAALISLLYLMATPSLAMQILAAREVARRVAAGDFTGSHAAGRQFHRWAAAVGIVVVLLFLALSVPLDRVMQIGSPLPVALIGAVGAIAILGSVLRGILQGRGDFAQLALSLVVDPVARIVALAVLLLVGLRFGAGIGAYLASVVCVYGITAMLVARGRISEAEVPGTAVADAGSSPRATLRSIVPYALIAGLTTALYSVDVLVARSVLPEHEAGIYAAVALLGRALYFAGAAAGTVMLPIVTQHVTRGADHRHVLAQSLAFVAALAGGGLLVYIVVPRLVVTATYGQAFQEVDANLALMGLAMSLFAVAYLGINYLIALGRWRMLPPIGAVVVSQLTLLAAFHGSVREIVLVQVAVMAMLNLAVWPVALAGEGSWLARGRPRGRREEAR